MPRVPPIAGMPKARARIAAWPAGLASSIATPAMPRGMPVEQLRRPQPPGQQDGAGWHRRARRVAGQRGQQPAGQILEIGQPLAQVGIADPAHAVVHFAGDPLHRRLGRQAAADHLGDALQPAGIGGDQAVGFQHLARR